MSHILNRVLVRLVVAFGVCVGPTAFAQKSEDTVQTVSGSRLQGEVVSATPATVSMNIRGSRRELKTNEIRYIAFGDEPTEMTNGRARVLSGKYKAALADLKKINPLELKRDLVRRDLQFYLAMAQARLALTTGGDKPVAEKSMLAFVRAAPNSQHFFNAAETLGDLAFAQSNMDSAVRYYGAISSKAPFPEIKMRGAMAEAKALVFLEQYAKALDRYSFVLASPTDTKAARRQKLFARIGRGRCLAETDSSDKGIREIEAVIRENDPEDKELFGRAYNAHGDCFRKAGKAKDALLAYLHVDVLFYGDPETHAEALYHLSKLWAATKQSDRAVSAKKLLDEKYSGSVWSAKP